ncbi:MAG: hypothetical protein IJP16_05025 [Clostridia bacterium]|nr:hypothetical protein [Clostridia bacterium]MBQ9975854.1 hypothetical protein [Clostridia bacterium]
MTEAEVRNAFNKHLPVVLELRGVNRGDYHYTYVSALVERYDRLTDKTFAQAEVIDTKTNSCALVDPSALRLATPEELIKTKTEVIRDDPLSAFTE